MRKSTRAISLVLIGSGLILAGCLGCTPPDTGQGGPSSGHPGAYYRPYVGGTRAAEPAASPRGGFGAAAHAEGGS